MLAIAAAGAFVALFVLWVVLPRKLLKNKNPRAPRPVRRRGAPPPSAPAQPDASTLSPPNAG